MYMYLFWLLCCHFTITYILVQYQKNHLNQKSQNIKHTEGIQEGIDINIIGKIVMLEYPPACSDCVCCEKPRRNHGSDKSIITQRSEFAAVSEKTMV